jgi:hypothetical protein
VVSVTQSMSVAGRIKANYYTPESAERGIRVHLLTEQFDAGSRMMVPSELAGYLDAYAEAIAQTRLVFAGVEIPAVSPILGVGGRIDRVIESMWGRRLVPPGKLDIKTSQPQSWHGVQLAGYNRILKGGERWALYLQANGRWKILRYDDPFDDRRFLADLAKTHRYLTTIGDDDWLIPPPFLRAIRQR